MTWGILKSGKRQNEMSICCRFICLHYVNNCHVRVCCGLLPPVLNAVAGIVAEAGSAELGLALEHGQQSLLTVSLLRLS